MKNHLNTIEYDKILKRAAAFAVNELARQKIVELAPVKSREEAIFLLEQTREADLLLNKYRIDPLAGFDDISEILSKARKNVCCSMGELLKIASAIRAFRIAKAAIEKTDASEIIKLKQITANISYDKKLEEDINKSIISDNEMSDFASKELGDIRRKIRTCNDKINEKLKHYIKSTEYSKYLQESIITMRQGRFVIPVKAEAKSSITGLLHDRSSSGATVFIEPMPVVELNNELRLLQIEEQYEIDRILAEFSVRVCQCADMLEIGQEYTVLLDVIFSKAKYSASLNAVYPQVFAKNKIKIVGGRHPLIDANKVVPIDLEVGEKGNILLITGPNTGGKTVSLKTAGLFCVMAATGLFLPAKSGTGVCVFNQIYCDIGDEQSIENSLSTFSSHIKNIAQITDAVCQNDLVLFDELGAGTDPYEGAALGLGVIKYLLEKNCVAILTTHYSELKEFALTDERITNASMEFDAKTLLPTYRIIMGLPGASNAISIAAHIGINQKIIDEAKKAISGGRPQFEDVLKSALEAKTEAQKYQEEALALRRRAQDEYDLISKQRMQIQKERESIQSNAKVEVRKIAQRAREAAEEIILELKDKLDKADEKALFEARFLSNKIQGIDVADDERMPEGEFLPLEQAPTIGSEVYIKLLNTIGTVISVQQKDSFLVSAGKLQLNLKLSELAAPPPKKPKKQAVNTTNTQPNTQQDIVQQEIKLLGYTVVEAEAALDVFIENAKNAGATQIKIIHGLGTGALRKGVQAYLKGRFDILEFRAGKYGEGENGVTIATIKQ